MSGKKDAARDRHDDFTTCRLLAVEIQNEPCSKAF